MIIIMIIIMIMIVIIVKFYVRASIGPMHPKSYSIASRIHWKYHSGEIGRIY